jgi:hypothetical protein
MFEGLNTIPWAELTHAYGSAEEVPMWLRQLMSHDAKVRKEAMNHLGARSATRTGSAPRQATQYRY